MNAYLFTNTQARATQVLARTTDEAWRKLSRTHEFYFHPNGWMSAPKHNTNAVKGQQAATSWLQIRVTPADKAAWVKAARESGTANLTEYVTRQLNAAPEMITALEAAADFDGNPEDKGIEERLHWLSKMARGALARAAYHH